MSPMKSKMSEEKDGSPLDSSAVFVTESNVRTVTTKKYVVAVIGVVLALAMILAAVLVGMHIFTAAQKDIVKLSVEQENKFKGELISDAQANRIQYHFNTENFEAWVEDSFNQGIRVMKIKTGSSGIGCFVTFLNSDSLMNTTLLNHNSKKKKKLIIPSNYSYAIDEPNTVSTFPIADSSFLSDSVRAMCDGQSTYWLYSSCHENKGKDDEGQRRQKRLEPLTIAIISAVVCVIVESAKDCLLAFPGWCG